MGYRRDWIAMPLDKPQPKDLFVPVNGAGSVFMITEVDSRWVHTIHVASAVWTVEAFRRAVKDGNIRLPSMDEIKSAAQFLNIDS